MLPLNGGMLMVGVAQLVEHLVVVQVAAGSSPVTHPSTRCRVILIGCPGTSLFVRVERTLVKTPE